MNELVRITARRSRPYKTTQPDFHTKLAFALEKYRTPQAPSQKWWKWAPHYIKVVWWEQGERPGPGVPRSSSTSRVRIEITRRGQQQGQQCKVSRYWLSILQFWNTIPSYIRLRSTEICNGILVKWRHDDSEQLTIGEQCTLNKQAASSMTQSH